MFRRLGWGLWVLFSFGYFLVGGVLGLSGSLFLGSFVLWYCGGYGYYFGWGGVVFWGVSVLFGGGGDGW